MSSVKERGLRAVNLKEFASENPFEVVKPLYVSVPDERQYVLRMLVKRPFEALQLPDEFLWLHELLYWAYDYQLFTLGITQPFTYITVRNGLVESVTDDEWHTDGFSVNVTHLPEQNYCWSDSHPTEFVRKSIEFPKDFSPHQHNIHQYIQDILARNPAPIETTPEKTLCCFDPYVIHRRPQIPQGIKRCFVRISMTPIEICDDNNTPNPLLPTPKYNRDAVKSFRNRLERYSI